MKLLEVENLSVSYGKYEILKNVDFFIEENQWLMLIGPNGAGKSTLINAVSQYIDYTGKVLYLGENIKTFNSKQLAQNIGVLSQNYSINYPYTVKEVVSLGRYAYSSGIFSKQSSEDEEKVNNALELTGLSKLANRSVLTLSGGELQRTFLAQVLAQDPKILMLDEPTSHLDLVYQKDILELIKKWFHKEKRAVISVVHDLSLAKAYGTHGLLLNKGSVIAKGRIDEVFIPEYLNKTYSMDVYLWMDEILGKWKKS